MNSSEFVSIALFVVFSLSKISDLNVEQKVFLVKSFYERRQSFAAAVGANHTKYGKHINVSHNNLRRQIHTRES